MGEEEVRGGAQRGHGGRGELGGGNPSDDALRRGVGRQGAARRDHQGRRHLSEPDAVRRRHGGHPPRRAARHAPAMAGEAAEPPPSARSEEHTSELQSLMRISYAVFRLKKKKKDTKTQKRDND